MRLDLRSTNLCSNLKRTACLRTDIYDWCALDTGKTSFYDPSWLADTSSGGGTIGADFDAYVSRTRDGSVWLRFGPDDKSPDWNFVDEPRRRFQTVVLDAETVARLGRLNYTEWCVLTDLTLRVDSVGTWHPTFLHLYDPSTRQSRVIVTKHSKVCRHQRLITLVHARLYYIEFEAVVLRYDAGLYI